ncbi:MAG: hypothetical protein KY475_11435 [Planctomycetes bacterium]|nr:hypothetical protein [Planctomycetota bacterium]
MQASSQSHTASGWRPRFGIAHLALSIALCALVLAFGRAVARSWLAPFHPEQLAVDEEGTTVACGFANGTVKLWRRPVGRTFSFHAPSTEDHVEYGGTVAALRFGDQGRHLVSVSSGGAVKAWDVESEDRISTFQLGHFLAFERPQAAAISPSGRLVASLSESPQSRWYLHDVLAGTQVAASQQQDDEPTAIAFSPDSAVLAVGYQAERIELLDGEQGTPIRTLPTDAAPAVLAISPDSRMVAFADRSDSNPKVRIVDADTAGHVADLKHASLNSIVALAFSSDGSTLAACDDAGRVMISNVARQTSERLPLGAGRLMHVFPVVRSPRPAAVTFGAQPDKLLTGHFGRIVRWSVASMQREEVIWSRLRMQAFLFAAAFILWCSTWALLIRRHEQPRTLPAPSELEAPRQDATEPQAVEAAPVGADLRPPSAVRGCWIMMAGGGIVAILASMAWIFEIGGWCIFLPGPYYGILVGMAATIRGVSQSRRGLHAVCWMQTSNLVNCDIVNFVLGIISRSLLQTPAAQQYLAGRPSAEPRPPQE